MPTKIAVSTKQPIIIDGKPYYPFIPLSRLAMIVTDGKSSYIYYHFEGFTPESHALGSMVCQSLCGHRLKRFHWSCLRCGYRLAWLGKIPKLRRLKMIYMVYIPAELSFAVLKDKLRRLCLTLAESFST
jgi:hypothetical protein